MSARSPARFPVALRDIRLVSEPDATGRSFALHVNGRPVFARGANWIPADALPGRITEEKTRALLQSAADANMNMIRVWGGGRYEPASFYETCDELGLLVWQDFMFACHLYPATDDFLAEVDARGRPPGHAASATTSRSGAATTSSSAPSTGSRAAQQPRPLPRRLRPPEPHHRAGAEGHPARRELVAVEPLARPDVLRRHLARRHLGDMHFWSVWHEGRDFEHYRDVRPRFCSEFGFQSYTRSR